MKPELAKTIAKSVILVGSKEQQKMQRSAQILHDTIPQSELQVLKQYYHGELSLNHPKDYVDLLIHLVATIQ